MKKILSVIIPFYQETENELFFPLSAINTQAGVRLEDIECILVNDGGDIKLSKDFMALFANISLRAIYLSENKGPGVARQRGLEEAVGDYVMFCDADDTLCHAWAIRKFFAAIENDCSDLIYTPIIIEYRNPYNEEYTYVLKDEMVQILHGKVYRRAYLQKENIRFNENLRLYEDIYFNEIAFAGTESIKKINETSYLKKYRANSLTRSDSYSYFIETMDKNIQSADCLLDEFKIRFPKKFSNIFAQKIIYFYFIMHWPQWENENEQLLLRKWEKLLGNMIMPRADVFEQLPKDEFALIYNQKREKFCTWDGETEPFAEWFERIVRGA